MTDLLIRNVDDETVRRVDAEAARQGLSRTEYLRREVARIAHRGPREVTRADLERTAEALRDLTDEAVMAQAWA